MEGWKQVERKIKVDVYDRVLDITDSCGHCSCGCGDRKRQGPAERYQDFVQQLSGNQVAVTFHDLAKAETQVPQLVHELLEQNLPLPFVALNGLVIFYGDLAVEEIAEEIAARARCS